LDISIEYEQESATGETKVPALQMAYYLCWWSE
jgi:hypothetical protein